MTQGRAQLDIEEEADARQFLAPLLDDGLVSLESSVLQITEKGRPFLRNAAVFFDLRLRRAQPPQKLFSRSI